MMATIELRPEVRAFAEAMEAKMLANDHSGGWDATDHDYIWTEIHRHLGKMTLHAYHAKWDKILPDAADVANLCMILCDILGVLDVRASDAGADKGVRDGA
jgi:hypothetical protein